ncbi:hypothetical protein MTO96_015312 [Rhipicephalus appendiculatus]
MIGGRLVKETFDVLLEMSQLLNTGLDAQSLALCVKLCESGVNPEALACLIKGGARPNGVQRQHFEHAA